MLCLGLVVVTSGLLLSGCGTAGHRFDDGDGESNPRPPANVFYRGDLVIISFSSPGLPERKPHEERVKDDGTITPPEIGSVKALGKTTGELQQELQKEYNKLYQNMTITVKSELRYYYVEGEVKTPGPKTYLGETDILSAISAAGGFTEFAKKSQVRLIRPNGEQVVVDYQRAIREPKHNISVFPGDKIYIRRSLY